MEQKMSNCTKCGKKLSFINRANEEICLDCYDEIAKEKSRADWQEKKRTQEMEQEARAKEIEAIVVTTDPAHKLPVVQHIDVIATEVVVGMNIFKDLLSGVRNIVGGRTGNIQNALRDIRKQALYELRVEAAELGADAVVGVDLDYNEIGATGSTMLMLVASGTAVKLKDNM